MAMNEHKVRQLNPTFNRLRQEYDASNVRLDYNELIDTLYIYVIPGQDPLVSVPQEDGLTALMVNPVTEEVHGFQIDDYLHRAVSKSPHLLELAPLAGIDQEAVDSAREQISVQRRREATISASLSELLAGPVRSKRT